MGLKAFWSGDGRDKREGQGWNIDISASRPHSRAQVMEHQLGLRRPKELKLPYLSLLGFLSWSFPFGRKAVKRPWCIWPGSVLFARLYRQNVTMSCQPTSLPAS